MSQEENRIHLTVAAIIEKQGKFLLVEEHDLNAPGYPDDKVTVLNQPAGHVEDFESIIDAVIRETLEETAWHFTPRFACGIYRWQHPNNDIYIRHCFSGDVSNHETDRDLDTGIVKADWFSLDAIRQQVVRHRSPLVLKCIEDYLAGQRFPLDMYQDL
jgi:ADP-ribose pyrophosphatase YjhB (NUDIX family)